MPKVSIIIPVYNVEKYLRNNLTSVTNQTLKDIEIICINDGSKDSSFDIIQEFAQKDSRIVVINQENEGLSAARNTGIERATGEYIAFLDSDDYVDLDYYEKLYTTAIEHNAEISAAGIIRKYSETKEKYRIKYDTVEETTDVVEMFELSNIKRYPSCWNRIYKKELIDRTNLRFNEGKCYEDAAFSIRALNNCKKFVTVPKVIYYYIVNNNSIVKTKLTEKKKADKLFAERDRLKYVKDHHIGLPDQYFRAMKYKVRLGGLTLYTLSESIKTDTYLLFGHIPVFRVKTETLPVYQLDKIIVESAGRMANQMFCWAFAKSLSKKSGLDFLIDDSSNSQKLSHFECFEDYKKHSVKKCPFKKLLRTIIPIRSIRNSIAKEHFNMPHVNEGVGNFMKYQPKLMEIKEPTYISGFYQTEKYFKYIREDLLKDFTLKTPLNKKNQEILDKINSTESVSLHFRRGDYTKKNNQKTYGTFTEEYYQNAVKTIAEKTGKNLTLFVFSDDINWVKENVKFDYETVYVDVNNDKQGYFDLELMKHCKHNVIANSSFSWWGAWLNENENKIVVAPQKWIATLDSNYDIIPENWITLQNLK